ncbi:hypothetical protein [Arachnia propionica]|nr:hypothetical protein [Arachnia propionica]VEJ59468.1 Uncharacterised protein [Arachnia propionica]
MTPYGRLHWRRLPGWGGRWREKREEGLLDDYLPRLTDPGGAVTFPLRAL